MTTLTHHDPATCEPCATTKKTGSHGLPPDTHHCPRCHTTWTGKRAAHCGGRCHRTFTSDDACEDHKRYPDPEGACVCLDPASLVDSQARPMMSQNETGAWRRTSPAQRLNTDAS